MNIVKDKDMIINDRKDLDALPKVEQDAFKARLAASIYGWEWGNGQWAQVTYTGTISRFGFDVSDFPDAPKPAKPTSDPDADAAAAELEQARAARAAAYAAEADPLFFKAQRGEATLQEWQDKVTEIRDRVPYPEKESPDDN